MLPSQRHLFDVPADITFFNAAAWGPLPKATVEAAKLAVERKARPWLLDQAFAGTEYNRCRQAAARLINAEPADVALVSSVGYGVATVGKIFAPAAGSRVLVLENDHTSPVLEWLARADAQGFTVETVPQPADGDWTSAVLEAIDRPRAAPVSLASISSIHWSDGGMLDIEAIAVALKKVGAAFSIDATHGVGVIAMDVARLEPDFVIWPTYKWLVGPYGRAFVYVAKRHQDGVPLEQTAPGRRDVRAESAVYFADMRYLPDARRFDMGERDHFISMEMAAMGMELMASLGADKVRDRLAMLTRAIAEGLDGLPVTLHAERLRAPHILSVGFPGGMPGNLVERLAAERVYAAPRLGRLRISPHVYNDEADVARFVSVLGNIIRRTSR